MSSSQPRQQDTYPANRRDDVRPSIPVGVRSALDVGCSRGGFGLTLREVLGPDARIVGVEAMPEAAAEARQLGGFDEVVDGYFPDALDGRSERFDLISFNDVLEHIVDPWQVLQEVKRFLTPDGAVVAAIPNVEYLPVLLDLVKGRWDYADHGVLDRTHVRFFTRSTMLDMFESCGYEVIDCRGANVVGPWYKSDRLWMRRRLKKALTDRAGDRRFMHFVVTARPR